MSGREVAYRVSRRRVQRHERAMFYGQVPVYAVRAYGEPPAPVLSGLGLNLANDFFTAMRGIELLSTYNYDEYRMRWHAAFQSGGDWPVRFAYDYLFSADDVPGDIRTNWELNRHHQFSVLAKSYYASGDESYFDELSELFEDWNDRNPFLWGPEWASPMEESIRLVNWLVAAAFLDVMEDGGKVACELRERLAHGAWVMAAHVRRHYSCYSSANNHTVVEAAGVGIAAAVFGEEGWLSEAMALLEAEVVRQTWPDGVNKEQALHYQLFVMEALCLLVHVLHASGHRSSEILISQIRLMAHYVRACSVDRGRYIEFGDNDEGRILNLSSSNTSYPEYVLSLASLECSSDCRWVQSVDADETVRWLYSKLELERAGSLPLQPVASVESFPDGGVTVLRADYDRIVLAFDHGPLGLDPLAAHGHADALSVQLFVDGEPVLIDPGTYIYNGNQRMRSLFRSTAMHNTVCIDGRDQSEMLGPFLWGSRASAKMIDCVRADNTICVSASHDGYAPIRHCRSVSVTRDGVSIVDKVSGCSAEAVFITPLAIESLSGTSAVCRTASGCHVRIEATSPMHMDAVPYSSRYGRLGSATRIIVSFCEEQRTVIRLDRSGQ